jgi:hypothetical protein
MAEIIRFPGFIILDDRNTILKDGKRYPSIKAVIADLPYEDCKRTYEWRVKRCIGNGNAAVTAVLDYRTRMLRNALYGDGRRQQGRAA